MIFQKLTEQRSSKHQCRRVTLWLWILTCGLEKSCFLVIYNLEILQFMLYTVGRIHNGTKVMFCFMHVTESQFRHYAKLLMCIDYIRWKPLETCVNACWVYSVESVSQMYSAISVTFLIFLWVVCVKLAHSSLGSRACIFSNSSCYHNQIGSIYSSPAVIFFRGCVPGMVVPSYDGNFIHIPGKMYLVSFIIAQFYDVRK